MKKIALLLLSFIFVVSFSAKALAAPLLTDEIPQDYIKKVKAASKKSTLAQEVSDYDKATALKVKVYSPENIRLKYKTIRENYNYIYEITNIKINDCFTFLVSEDVYKDGKLFIKKDTPAVGYVQNLSISAGNTASPSEFRLSNFTTKDTRNNTVDLYGSVLNDYSGFIQLVTHAINKNKVYTLYYK